MGSFCIFGEPPFGKDFPLVRLLVIAFGETQLFTVNTSGRLDSCMDGEIILLIKNQGFKESHFNSILGEIKPRKRIMFRRQVEVNVANYY